MKNFKRLAEKLTIVSPLPRLSHQLNCNDHHLSLRPAVRFTVLCPVNRAKCPQRKPTFGTVTL